MRRLPVIQESAPEDATAAARPPWQWSFIGAGLAVTIWAPLAVLAVPLGAALAARVVHERPADVAAGKVTSSPSEEALLAVIGSAPVLVAFALAAALSGGLVGRFGGRAGPREAALAGILAAVFVTSIAVLAGTGLPPRVIFLVVLVLALLGAGSGFTGGRIGVGKRPC
jgi:hypothetical protein